MSRTSHAQTVRAAILELLAAGPMTVEALHGAIKRTQVNEPAAGTVRTLCNEMRREGALGRVLVRTPRTRGGIGVWHLPNEDSARVEAVVATVLARPMANVSFDGRRPPLGVAS